MGVGLRGVCKFGEVMGSSSSGGGGGSRKLWLVLTLYVTKSGVL